MSRTLRYSLAALIFLLPAFSTSTQPAEPAKRASSQNEFQSLIDRYYAAWNTGDPEKAAPLYAKDADLIFYDITPLKYTGWTQYDAGVRNVLGSFASAKFTPQSDLKATRRGNVAWTTVTWHLSGTKKTGEAVEMDGRHTAFGRIAAETG